MITVCLENYRGSLAMNCGYRYTLIDKFMVSMWTLSYILASIDTYHFK